MTPQERLVTLGALGILVAKFYFKQDWKTSLFFGAVTVSIVAVITAKPDQTTS